MRVAVATSDVFVLCASSLVRFVSERSYIIFSAAERVEVCAKWYMFRTTHARSRTSPVFNSAACAFQRLAQSVDMWRGGVLSCSMTIGRSATATGGRIAISSSLLVSKRKTLSSKMRTRAKYSMRRALAYVWYSLFSYPKTRHTPCCGRTSTSPSSNRVIAQHLWRLATRAGALRNAGVYTQGGLSRRAPHRHETRRGERSGLIDRRRPGVVWGP